jgi:mRNA interferase RelE/StbE
VGGGTRIVRRAGREYEIRLHPEAIKAYERLHPPIRDRVRAAIDGLATVPRPPSVVKLAGSNDYRIRVGDLRLVYAVDDRARLIVVARIGHRREVYRR